VKVAITTTAREVMDLGAWSAFCTAAGVNEWALNEGLLEEDTELVLLVDQESAPEALEVAEALVASLRERRV